MNTYTIRRGDSSLSTDLFGAQLNSFCIGSKQYIWQRNAEVWKESAPVLFPIVGELKGEGKTTLINGKPYHIEIHGFAKRNEFRVESATDTSVTLSFESNEETKKQYPFDFKLSVKFTLNENGFSQIFGIENRTDGEMPFFIGAHPAFNVPLFGDRFEDYTVTFEKPETVGSYRIDADGLVDENVQESVFVDGNKIPMCEQIFEKGALVFEGLNSRSVTLTNRDGHGVKMDFDGFDYFGIWRKTGDKAAYVCLEPWTGMNDCYGENGVYTDKRGIKVLKKGETFTVGYDVTVI